MMEIGQELHWETYTRFVVYLNDSKHLDRHVWANSEDPDQTAP